MHLLSDYLNVRITQTFPTCASLFLHFYIFISCSDELYTETIKRVLREYHNRITALEDKKFDIEYVVKKKDFEVLLRKQQLRERLRENVQNDNATFVIQLTMLNVALV